MIRAEPTLTHQTLEEVFLINSNIFNHNGRGLDLCCLAIIV
jgi:hypothetical protein